MALRTSTLVQNQNNGINFNGASIGGNIDPVKVQKKGGGLGGRRPLGDLSNAQKPSLDLTLKKGGKKNLADDVNRKGSTIKTSERVQKSTTTRKALTDISNSGKPRESETVKKNSKLKVLAEEPCHINSIAEEGFLHNHQECIKLQAGHKDIDYFMETLGLRKDLSKKLASPWASPTSSRLKMEDLLRSLQHEEMTELLGVGSPQKHEHFKELDSPYPHSPGSPYDSMLWKKYDDINFTMAETPGIPRF